MAVPSAAEAWAAYHDDLLLGRRRRDRTIADYQFAVHDFWGFASPTPWHRVTAEHFQAYLNRPARAGAPGRPLSPNYRAWLSRVVLAFYAWAAARGLLRRNPLEGIRPEPSVEGVARGLDQDQVDRLLAVTADRPRTHLLVALGFFALLRAGEIARLRIEHVDLRAGVLIIHSKGGYVDTVPIHHDLRPILQAALEGLPRTGPVVSNAQRPGRAITARTVSTIVSEAMAQAGVHESLHALRHSAAYLLLEVTGNVYVVSRLLRHRRLSSTEVYVRRADRGLAAQLDLLARRT
jgi:site-specific recombinase XerC